MQDILIPLLTIVEVLVCLLLVLIILMQRPRQEGLGAAFGEGVTSQMWGAQTTNVLQRGTAWLAGALFITTVVLASLISSKHGAHKSDKLFNAPAAKAEAAAPAPAAAPAAKTEAPKPAEAPKAATPAPAPAKPVEAPKAATPAPAKPEAPKPVEAPKAAVPAPAPAAPAPATPEKK